VKKAVDEEKRECAEKMRMRGSCCTMRIEKNCVEWGMDG